MSVELQPISTMHPVAGFELGIASAGIKTDGRKDVVLMRFDDAASVAGVFTQNAFCAAPVLLARKNLDTADTSVRYLLVNTGNANAGTGPQGMQDAEQSCQALASLSGCENTQVLPFSTGVIGEPLPIDKLIAALPEAVSNLGDNNWAEAAAGIMTTDTQAKGYSKQFVVDAKTYTVTGISKGAGMIQPNMATMLGFVACDAAVDSELLQSMLALATNRSFNRITIDGDTSTNDSCILVATGAAGNAEVDEPQGELYQALMSTLIEVFEYLAQAIVRDGEGATKFVTIDVEQGLNEQEALDVAYTVANSPLVKTALFASDANWGRILAAVGRAGLANLEVDGVQIYLGDTQIVADGGRAPSYTEEAGEQVMAQAEIRIRIQLGRGLAKQRIWTTDLSHEYVRINAEYRT